MKQTSQDSCLRLRMQTVLLSEPLTGAPRQPLNTHKCQGLLPSSQAVTRNVTSNKALLILFGESFRLGNQYTRNRGSEKSYNEQMNASKSHMKLISFLKQKQIDVEVSINSYTTKYDDNLTNIYKEVLYDKIFYPELIGQNGLIHNCMKRINYLKEYDFVLCMRIDICLKDKFMEIFNPHSSKILFPSICFEPHHKVGNHPRVNDLMLYVPKKYIGLFKEKDIQLSHRSWFELIEHYKLDYSELDTMLNTYHDSDSAKDYNPIYYIVNRRENKIHRTKKIFDKYNF